MAEKFSIIPSLKERKKELTGQKKLALVGQGDFPGANNIMRATMNIKHQVQHLTIDNPEFPYIYDGKENVAGENSSFYERTKGYPCEVVAICKKYDDRLKGKVRSALYFLYYKDLDAYYVKERKEVENLTEDFGFCYNNEYIDACEVGDIIPPKTTILASTSYDEYGNTGVGINGRILFGTHPMVQDDAIIVSESFAKRGIMNHVTSKTIPIGENTILLNLYGDDNEYRGLPNIGDTIDSGILCATRNVKESRMFSDMRDSSLSTINLQADQVFYADGEVIDINIYCNNPDIKANKANRQLIEYYNDLRWFYTAVYKACKKIVNSGAKFISKDINRWMRKAMDYLDKESIWAFNDNTFSNMMVEILLCRKDPIKIGRKIVGRSGNKTVVSSIWKDEDMPFLTTEVYKDEYGVVHPKGEQKRVELITNPLAIINRTIPMALFEPSITCILEQTQEHMKTLSSVEEQHDFMFDVLSLLNKKYAKELDAIYKDLSDREKKEFIEESIAKGIRLRWESFDEKFNIRDNIIAVHKKYSDIIKPYHIFVPKPKWGRDIYIGEDFIGYQYMMILKQSGEKGFSARSAGAISDESLPEKSHENKVGKHWASQTPIRFGEYETPVFEIITSPTDFALITALYRSSIDGRKFMYESVVSDSGTYDIPDDFTSRTSEIFQVLFKSLGVKAETIINEDEYIGEPEHDTEIVAHRVKNRIIFCSITEMYYLKKLKKMYKRYRKDHPDDIVDFDEAWSYILDNLPFKRKQLTDNIINLFKNNLEVFQ